MYTYFYIYIYTIYITLIIGIPTFIYRIYSNYMKILIFNLNNNNFVIHFIILIS